MRPLLPGELDVSDRVRGRVVSIDPARRFAFVRRLGVTLPDAFVPGRELGALTFDDVCEFSVDATDRGPRARDVARLCTLAEMSAMVDKAGNAR